jgi:hypothetical protein
MYRGGRHKVECPNCGNRDTASMTTGQRWAYAECPCGFCFDVVTGMGKMKHRMAEDELDPLPVEEER